jgi:hypothetical protein
MAFTKIQPQQLQLPTFLSPSGEFVFVDNTTGFDITLNRDLTGDFTIDGSLLISSQELLTSSASNSSDDTGKALGGISNTATGINVVVNGNAIDANSGSFNTALNGKTSNFGRSGEYNTIVCGRNVSFSDQITGSTVIADQATTAQDMTKNNSLLISFDSGVEFKTPNSGVVFSDNVVFNDSVYLNNEASFADDVTFNDSVSFNGTDVIFDSDIKLDSSETATFSGNCGFSGNVDFNTSVQFSGVVTLTGGEAVSSGYLEDRVVRHDFAMLIEPNTTTGTTTPVEAFGDITVNNLETVLTGDLFAQNIVTGHILTGTSVAYFVVEGSNFTGAIPFPASSYVAI